MWLCDVVCWVVIGVFDVVGVLVEQVVVYLSVIMFGKIYLQFVQLILLVYYLFVYVYFLLCDLDCIVDFDKCVVVFLYGLGVLVGLLLGLDFDVIVVDFGFLVVVDNFVDVIVVCDFVVEVVFVFVMIVVDLFWLVEDIIVWSLMEFGYVMLYDLWFIGSLIMLQKKNLDIVELVCGKFGWLIGNLVGLLVILKVQFLVYNCDLQEDKELVFDLVVQLELLLLVMVGLVVSLIFNVQWMVELVLVGYMLVIDFVEWFVW